TRSKARGLSFTLQDIFAAPVLRSLALRATPVDARACPPAAFDLVAPADAPLLDRDRLEDAYPTTSLIDALYLLSETSSRYEVYVTSCELAAVWNSEVFETALTRVVWRHP